MMNRQMWRCLIAAMALTLTGGLMIFYGGRMMESYFAAFILVYLAAGIVFFAFLSKLYESIGLKERSEVFPILIAGSLWVIVIWPFVALIALLCWSSDLFHVTSKRKETKKREEAAKREGRFTHMRMEELLSEQRKVVEAMARRE